MLARYWQRKTNKTYLQGHKETQLTKTIHRLIYRRVEEVLGTAKLNTRVFRVAHRTLVFECQTLKKRWLIWTDTISTLTHINSMTIPALINRFVIEAWLRRDLLRSCLMTSKAQMSVRPNSNYHKHELYTVVKKKQNFVILWLRYPSKYSIKWSNMHPVKPLWSI